MTIPKPPEAITFDCWETLITNVDWEQTKLSRYEAVRLFAGEHGIELTADTARETLRGGWDLHVQAWRRGETFGSIGAAKWCLGRLGIPASDDNVALLAERMGASPGGTRPLDGAREAIEKVRASGIPTALICDTGFTSGAQVRACLAEHSLELDHYFFSDEVGAPKPSPKIFDAALSTLGTDPSQAIHIGDLKRTDIAGARAAGMASIRYTGSHDNGWDTEETKGEEADAVLATWKELPEVIGLT